MRKITYIVIHCSATRPDQRATVAEIDRWHKQRGFRKIGYHYVIYPDGSLHTGRSLSEPGAHVQGNNTHSIGICYVGGLDPSGKPFDTRTPEQKAALFFLLQKLKDRFPEALILGHRDFSPDLNGDGIIQPWEWIKACPCFDAAKEYIDL